MQFVLDNLLLSKSEKTLVAENRVSAIHANQPASLTSTICSSTHEPNESGSDRRSLSENLERSFTRSKKKPSLKEAVITEVDQESEEFKQLPDVIASSHLGNWNLDDVIAAKFTFYIILILNSAQRHLRP